MGDAVEATVRAYDLDAQSYAGRTQVPDGVRADLDQFAAALGVGARVLELSAARDEVSR